jgi:hypothetical protein
VIKSIASDALITPEQIIVLLKAGGWNSSSNEGEVNDIEWVDFWAICLAMAAGTFQAASLMGANILASTSTTAENTVPASIISSIVAFLARAEGQISSDGVVRCLAQLTELGDSPTLALVEDTLYKNL